MDIVSEDDEPVAKIVAAFGRNPKGYTGRSVETVTLPVRELTVAYPRGYQHPDPRMNAILRETEALGDAVEAVKPGTAHRSCAGWRFTDGTAWCSCGVAVTDIGTVPPPELP